MRPPGNRLIRKQQITQPTANVVKLAGNSLITTVLESLAEAMALVRKFALDAQTFLDFLTGSLFAAPVYRTYGSLVAADRLLTADNRSWSSDQGKCKVPKMGREKA